ncbi:MAG: hypothetical protein U0271_24680 [Polyangiaceae bacterium]
MSLRIDLSTSEVVAGQPLRGSVELGPTQQLANTQVLAILRYRTEGRGDQEELDLPARVLVPVSTASLPATVRFEIPTPTEPWSYEGVILKIHWFLEITVGAERAEVAFHLASPFARREVGGPHRSPG